MSIIDAELDKWDLGKLDKKFQEYQHVNRDLAEREFEIRYPYRQADLNVGGGKSAMRNDSEQRVLEKIERDPRMEYLRELKRGCEQAIGEFDDELTAIYILRYTKPIIYKWDTVGRMLEERWNKGKPDNEKRFYPHSTIYRKRYTMLKLLAKAMGYI